MTLESPRYPLIFDSWGDEELKAISDVVRSGRFSMGPYVKEFEIEFAKKFDVQYAICVNSGSSANLLAVAALRFFRNGLQPGDEIIVPSIGWSTTYSPLFYAGFTPKFVDVDRTTFNIDVEQVRLALTERTKAILCVNLLGKCANFSELMVLAKERGLIILEDNCESMGASHNGIYAGTFGLAGTFSFFFSHHISTIEGGMIVTNDREFRDICICLRAHGWLRDLDHNSHLFDDRVSDFRRMFWFVLPGFNVRPTEFTGKLGLEQLEKFDSMLELRRGNHEYFIKKFQGNRFVDIQVYDSGHSAFSFGMILKKQFSSRRDELVRFLSENHIEARPIGSGDITRNPMVEKFFKDRAPEGVMINARLLDEAGFMVGNHPAPLHQAIDHLESMIGIFFED